MCLIKLYQSSCTVTKVYNSFGMCTHKIRCNMHSHKVFHKMHAHKISCIIYMHTALALITLFLFVQICLFTDTESTGVKGYIPMNTQQSWWTLESTITEFQVQSMLTGSLDSRLTELICWNSRQYVCGAQSA